MSDETFKIYIDRLRNGEQAEINESINPNFLDVNERFLSFKEPVKIEGEAYLAGETLVLHAHIVANCTIPCSICNEPANTKIEIEDFYHTEPLEDIRGGIFNFAEILREAILLETPAFSECNNGKCKKRKEIQKFLKKTDKTKDGEEGYKPFADLK